MKKLRLYTLLTSLSVGSVILTSILLLGSLFPLQKTNIENSLLESNIAYARKLADTTDHYFTSAQRELAWSASRISDITDKSLLKDEAERLQLESEFFNSVVVVDRNAVVISSAPESLNIAGKKLMSDASMHAVYTRKPFISGPFTSVAGSYVLFFSHPVFSSGGNYLGYIGGSVYLKKNSVLSEIISRHFYSHDSVISIVSNNGDVIFSQNQAMVGTRIPVSKEVRKKISTSEFGSFNQTIDGKDLLTGYASLNKADWHIFISGTSDTVRYILMQSFENVLWFLPWIVILMAIMMAVISWFIASPLEKLADMVRREKINTLSPSIEPVNAWYHEADLLKMAIQQYGQGVSDVMDKLSDEAMTDPLTRLCNRRGFQIRAERHNGEEEQCAVSIDIDFFKNINDTYGHDAGDEVLVSLAVILHQVFRTRDVLCRSGGEEFIVLLPETTLSDAARAAERIREKVSTTKFPHAGEITVSAGVAALKDCYGNRDVMLRRADEAMYKAKRAGRNLVVVFRSTGFSCYDVTKR